MSKMEKVFLANVLLYVDSLKTVGRFIMINSKCHDSTRFLKRNPYFNQKLNTQDVQSYAIFKQVEKQIEIFCQIETLRATMGELDLNKDKINDIEQLEATSFYFSKDLVGVYSKITRIELVHNNYFKFNLGLFPMLRIISITFMSEINVLDIFQECKSLKYAKIEMVDFVDLNFIDKIKNNDCRYVIFLRRQSDIDSVRPFLSQLENVQFCSRIWFDKLPVRILYYPQNAEYLVSSFDMIGLLTKTIPTHIQFQFKKKSSVFDLNYVPFAHSISLGSVVQLKNISLHLTSLTTQIYFKEMKQLHTIRHLTIHDFKSEEQLELPLYLTTLTLKNTKLCFNNLDKINLSKVIIDGKCGCNFKECNSFTSLSIENRIIHQNLNFLSLKKLSIVNCKVNGCIVLNKVSKLVLKQDNFPKIQTSSYLNHLIVDSIQPVTNIEGWLNENKIFLGSLKFFEIRNQILHNFLIPTQIVDLKLHRIKVSLKIISLLEFTSLSSLSLYFCNLNAIQLPLGLEKLTIIESSFERICEFPQTLTTFIQYKTKGKIPTNLPTNSIVKEGYL